MFSGWRKERVVDQRPGYGGWGPPHPPPEPLIPSMTPRTTRRAASPRHPGVPRQTMAATIRLIGAAAIGAAVLVALAILTTGLPSSPSRHTQRLARASSVKRAAPAPKTPPPAKKVSTAGRRTSRVVHKGPTTTAPPTPNDNSGSSTLNAVNAIVDETGAGRERVISAIEAVQGCTMSPSEGEAAVGQAVSVRQQGLNDLQQLDRVASVTAADRSVIQTLTAVINDSIQADRAYMAWMEDVAGGSSNCSSNPMGDANFVAGQAFSARADNDKQVFVSVWNPLAGQHGLSTYQPQDF
jgi:hypothetical protein